MRVLIVSQFFWPENFKINDVAKGLKERGHEVSVLTGIPNYPKGKFYKGYSFFKMKKEDYEGITIYRSFVIPRGSGSSIKLFLNYFSLALFASIRILFVKKKFDRILVFEASPITIGIPAIVAKYKFKAPIYFWVQDLWPESITAAGGVSNKSIISLVDKLTRFIYRNSKIILVQSKAFIPYIQNQGVRLEKIVYLPNSTESFYKKVKDNNKFIDLIPKDGPVLMFAGNIGEAQGFDTIIKASKYFDFYGKINLDIYGAVSDEKYWLKCENIIDKLPVNFQISYKRSIPNSKVISTISEYHFFILPTKGENFGHSIFESFIAGTPVLISNKTPWTNLEKSKVGLDLPLKNELWAKAIQTYIDMGNEEYNDFKKYCKEYVYTYRKNQNMKIKYFNFFKNII